MQKNIKKKIEKYKNPYHSKVLSKNIKKDFFAFVDGHDK
jgi:hypothetical protein